MNILCEMVVLLSDLLHIIIIIMLVLGDKIKLEKRKLIIWLAGSIGLWALSALINNYYLSINKNLIICMMFVYLFINYSMVKTILGVFLMYFVSAVLDAMIGLPLQNYFDINDEYIDLVAGPIGIVLLLCLILIYRKITHKTINISQNIWISLTIGLIIFFVIYAVTYPYYNSKEFHTSRYIIFAGVMAIIISFLGIFFIYFVNQNNELKIAGKVNDEKNKMLYNYYMQLEERDIEIRKFIHDYKNHVRGILYYAEEKKYDELIKYARTICEEGDYFDQVVDVGHNFVNAIINHYVAEAGKLDIKLDVEGSVIDAKNIEDYDWSTIIPNMLNNAIEETKKLEENLRKITFSIKNNQNKIVITMINPIYDVDNIQHTSVLKTTKSDKLNHGFGIKNIIRCVEKYHGDVSYSVNENNQFVTVVWMRCDQLS